MKLGFPFLAEAGANYGSGKMNFVVVGLNADNIIKPIQVAEARTPLEFL